MGEPHKILAMIEDHVGSVEKNETAFLLTEAAACIREMVEWRPIETAPRDGTPILIYQENAGNVFGHREHHMPRDALKPGEWSYTKTDPRLQWYDDKRFAIGYWRPWGGWGNRNSATVEPTHWLPLPPAPGAEA